MFRILVIILLAAPFSYAQERVTENIILVTLDGFRWQELFQSADSSLLFNKEYTKDQSAITTFWNSDSEKRREQLMPFFWNTIAQQDQLYGTGNTTTT
jgi:hypothetical protein